MLIKTKARKTAFLLTTNNVAIYTWIMLLLLTTVFDLLNSHAFKYIHVGWHILWRCLPFSRQQQQENRRNYVINVQFYPMFLVIDKVIPHTPINIWEHPKQSAKRQGKPIAQNQTFETKFLFGGTWFIWSYFPGEISSRQSIMAMWQGAVENRGRLPVCHMIT